MTGKTSLLEALLLASGAIAKKGNAKNHGTVGDLATDAKNRGVGSGLAVATIEVEVETWTFLDCPGAREFAQEAVHGLLVADEEHDARRVMLEHLHVVPARRKALADTRG